MGVEAHDLVDHEWTRWQGHVVNGVFPLGRCLGRSGHSGVFLTTSEEPGHRDVAIKLLPANRADEEVQLQRWVRASGLLHPHLLPLLESGSCLLDGLPYLYVVMEYADQTLAQLLLQRALTPEEAREMLVPILGACEFLHGQELVQGQLKPANVLVVGDQLKLASDTIRHRSDNTLSIYTPSAYDPPEGREGSSSTAADMWALGVSLLEALTRRSLSNLAGHRSSPALPADFSPEFRDVVTRCLSHRPQDRPNAAELLAWTAGASLKSVPETVVPPATLERPKPRAPQPAPSRSGLSQWTLNAKRSLQPLANVAKPRTWAVAALGAILILLLTWSGSRLFSAHHAPVSLQDSASQESEAPLSAAASPATTQPGASALGASAANPGKSDNTPPIALHEVIPDVPHSAARTIRGHIKVSVRATVDADGSVSAVVADRGGQSRYFQRLALEAAKKWTFPPLHAPSRRAVKIEFDFSRDATTGHAAPTQSG